jgi:glycosyltransferase involved in cell wall biosynthesis
MEISPKPVKILVVTFPADLGSRTIESNLCAFLGAVCDMRHFRFAAQDSEMIDIKFDHLRYLWYRLQDALKLRRAVRSAVLEGRKILFYNVSPALFTLGSWRGGKIYITLDWARRLFSPELKGAAALTSWINRRILHSCAGILPMTQAMATCLQRKYGVPSTRVHQVPSLFDVEHFDPGEIKAGEGIRVLYVGGDVKRKGGDLLYEAYSSRLKAKCSLTMVTNEDFPSCEGFTLRKGIRYGTPDHLAVMRGHDIFILPTHQDAGPQVIGEAAAAGLAVLTTKSALGAPHVINEGINGFISETPELCIKALEELLDHPEKIQQMRKESLAHMRRHYSRQVIASAYLKAMND